ncbi:BppU family phage baseplate upper protein [Staphylococcus pseudintermedius]|nr:BppU family phage baseplate upper protein [Staphylococcus pseudintermedius]
MDYLKARPNKTATIPLETTAYYQPNQELNISFYTMDINSAILKFIVTQNNEVLSIGEENAIAQIILKHQDGSKIVDDLNIYDPLNGILTYRIPNQFLSRKGQVKAQVYVVRRGKDVENTSYAVVAERIFSFNINESLIDSIDAETKLNYIVRFEELEKIISNRIKDIEDKFDSVDEYVERIENARKKGKSDIDLAITNGLEKIGEKYNEINNNLDGRLLEVSEFVNSEREKLIEKQKEINISIDDFNENKSNYVKAEETKSWQKTTLVEPNGDIPVLNDVDFNSPENFFEKSGFYYCINSSNQPTDQSLVAFVEYFQMSDTAYLIYKPFNSEKYFIKTRDSERQWSSWKSPFHGLAEEQKTKELIESKFNQIITTYQSKIYDTGWQQISFMNGVEIDSNVAASGYRIKNGVCQVIFNIKLTTDSIPSTSLPIFKLPNNYSPSYPFSFLARTNGISGKNPVRCSYDFAKQEFKVWQNNDNTLKSGDYIYGTFTFLVEEDQ